MRLVPLKTVQLKDGIDFEGDWSTTFSRPAVKVAVDPDLRLVVIGGSKETVMITFENVSRMIVDSDVFNVEMAPGKASKAA